MHQGLSARNHSTIGPFNKIVIMEQLLFTSYCVLNTLFTVHSLSIFMPHLQVNEAVEL